MEEEINIERMSDESLIDYLDDLERMSLESAQNGPIILEKVNKIYKRLRYRSNIDRRIKDKLDGIMKLM